MFYKVVFTVFIVHTFKCYGDSQTSDEQPGNRKEELIRYVDCIHDRIDKVKESVNSATKDFLKQIDEFEEANKAFTDSIQQKLDREFYNKSVFEAIINKRAVPGRLVTKYFGYGLIPSGFNIISPDNILALPNLLLYFYRLKVRDNTYFTLNNIHVDHDVIVSNFSLNDIYLRGTFDYLVKRENMQGSFVHSPERAEAEITLKNARLITYIHHQLINKKFRYLPLLVSKFDCDQIELTILNSTIGNDAGLTINLHKINIEHILDKMESTLNYWLQSFLNDYLWQIGNISPAIGKEEESKYGLQKSEIINTYVDTIINILKGDPHDLNKDLTVLPDYNFYLNTGAELKLLSGSVSGLLKSVYRIGSAVRRKQNGVRIINVRIGFSNVKAQYKYLANVNNGLPELFGNMLLNLDDMEGNLEIVIKENAFDVVFDFRAFQHVKPVSLTMKESLMRVKDNYNPIIEHHIIGLLTANVKTLFSCRMA